MFFREFKYMLLSSLRSRELIFWTLLFPFALTTFMYMAFGDIFDRTEKFEPVPVAIVKEQDNMTLTAMLNAVSAKGDNQLLITTYTGEKEAKKLLEEDQVKGIESGAEAYVTKPFNVKYLEKIVYRLIKREADLKEYYSSIFSSFTMEHGNCIHKEDQEFLDKMLEIIEKNIANPDLQVELLSSEMGYSTRQFYRKLKPITEQSPADIIKEYRLTMAERLLIAKNLTIEEIMDQTGFNNRGTFYKLFSKRYGMPPRQYREQQKENVKKEKISGISDE